MPAVVLTLSVFAGLETFSFFLCMVVLAICTGISISSFGEANFSLIGFIIVMIAVLMGSTKLVLSQILLQKTPASPPSGETRKQQ